MVSFVLFMLQPQVGKKKRKLHVSDAELKLLKKSITRKTHVNNYKGKKWNIYIYM